MVISFLAGETLLSMDGMLKDIGLEGVVSPARAAKKWENLKKTYKELRKPPTGIGTESGESTAGTWKWYNLMDEAIGGRPSIQPPILIASSEEESIVPADYLY
ncbi:TBC1 domain family member 10B-like protein [Labeo rohita]|uniref:TBC1 domain family member 10B-like protein n=1 Tax=Labeo rohita TaxID=84645 RepID=A0A498N5F2_LABRO|nr:TBC1 domain family member 10B-like protein [Labeo rohita]